MASVLRVNIMLLSPGKNDDSKELLKCLTDFSQELRQITEESHD
jgi:hypothetical protein